MDLILLLAEQKNSKNEQFFFYFQGFPYEKSKILLHLIPINWTENWFILTITSRLFLLSVIRP